MIGKDLVKYHNYVHGPVHYTTSVDAIGTPELSAYGLRPIPGLSGTAEDRIASKEDPFLGHMFIQGCVSASGWLSDDGRCVKLAKVQPPSGCNRGVDLCGDHMKGALHMSHLTLTDNPELTGYDFRNGEISFKLDKSTFKTVFINYDRPFSNVLHIQPTHIKPGCVSTICFKFGATGPKGYCKLTFHPGMKWLTQRPTYVTKQFPGYLSLESYGDTVEDVYCSYREECLQTCPEPECSLSGLSGFDTIDGDEDTQFDALSTGNLSGCRQLLKFLPWDHTCNESQQYNLTRSVETKFFYRFDDFYTDDGGTRLWNWSGEKDAITGIPIGHWYYSQPNVNHFRFKIKTEKVDGIWVDVPPIILLYRGDYQSMDDPLNVEDMIFNSKLELKDDDPNIMYLPLSKEYVVRYTREFGTRYIFRVIGPSTEELVKGSIHVTCPSRYIASRYIPK